MPSSFLPFSNKDVKNGAGSSSGSNGGDAKAKDAAGNLETDSSGSPSESSLSSWFSDAPEDPCIPSLTRKQRLLAFMGCIVLGAICIGLALLYLPVFYVKARKFALLFTLGSLAVLGALSMLRGPANFLRHMFSAERVVFSTVYLATLAATLYAAMGLRQTIPSIFFATLQLCALGSTVLNYVPGGITGLKIIFQLWWKTTKAVAVPIVSKVFQV